FAPARPPPATSTLSLHDALPIYDMVMPQPPAESLDAPSAVASALTTTLSAARRPIVLWGAGIGLAGLQTLVADWLRTTGLPFVSDRKSTRLNSSHLVISYAVFCL